MGYPMGGFEGFSSPGFRDLYSRLHLRTPALTGFVPLSYFRKVLTYPHMMLIFILGREGRGFPFSTWVSYIVCCVFAVSP